MAAQGVSQIYLFEVCHVSFDLKMGVTIVADQGVSQFYLEKCVMIHERFENLVISVST